MTTLRIVPVRERFWWPHPYSRPWLWRNVVVGYRYFVNGVETSDPMMQPHVCEHGHSQLPGDTACKICDGDVEG